MTSPGSIRVTVVYCSASCQHVREVEVAAGATAAEAIRLSGIVEAAQLKAADLERIGIFNRIVAPETRLQDGDRVEIYRPLLIDPKEARRRRAAPARRK